jgi:CheY-like chemotaxis protein
MAGGSNQPTALGIARARFVEGLERRANELAGGVAQLRESPGEDRPREELRRRLHALFASAQVFRIAPLAEVLQAAIARLDAARDEGRELSQEDLQALEHLVATLTEKGGDGAPEASAPESRSPAAGERGSVMPPLFTPTPPPRPSPEASARPSPEASASPPATQPEPKAPEVAAKPAAPVARQPGPRAPGVATNPEPLVAPSPGSPGAPRAPASPPKPTRAPSVSKAPASLPRGPAPSSKAAAAPPKRTTPPVQPAPPAAVKPPPPVVKASPTPVAPSPPAPPPRAPAATGPAPGSSTDTVISLLLLETPEEQPRIRAALVEERFEVLCTSDPQEALRLASTGAPDVIVASQALVEAGGSDWIGRLREDPLTDAVPLLLLQPAGRPADVRAARALGADEAMPKPVSPGPFVRTLERLADVQGRGRAALEPLGEVTLEQVADRVAQEVRRGLLDSAEGDRDLRVPLGEGAPVLAAAWSVVGRLRAEMAERSGGQLRFRDDARRGPALMALGGDGQPAAEPGTGEVSLTGRRVLVADDDPAVVWFFTGLLREEGATAAEAHDGRHALEQARRFHPDVVISDILMPEMDGLTLCRELARDPALHDVPVILISWKDDYLQRMRELSSGARGYLRKEAGSAQILDQVRRVLLPRGRIEKQLGLGGEVRGRIEGVGVVPLLRLVAGLRPDARVTVRDAWSLFDLDLRGGALKNLTRTATDGSFERGPAALTRLVGVMSGRFSVVDDDGPVRAAFDAPLDEVLDDASRRLGAVVDALSGSNLDRVAKVTFDEEALAAALDAADPVDRGLVDRVDRGERPRDLLMEGQVSPPRLERALVDLARRGIVQQVRGLAGEDRIEEAHRARGPRDEPPAAPTDAPSGGHEHALLGQALQGPPPPPVAPGDDEGFPQLSVETDPDGGDFDMADLDAIEAAMPPAPVVPASGPSGPVGAPTPAQATGAPTSTRPAPWKWVALVGVLAVIGFAGVRLWDVTRSQGPREAEAHVPPAAEPPPTGAPQAAPDEADGADEEGGSPLAQELAYGESIPRIDGTAGVRVGPGDGLLMVRPGPAADGTRLFIDGDEVGEPPAQRALAAGRHELEFRRGGATSFRYIYLQEGHTRIVESP